MRYKADRTFFVLSAFFVSSIASPTRTSSIHGHPCMTKSSRFNLKTQKTKFLDRLRMARNSVFIITKNMPREGCTTENLGIMQSPLSQHLAILSLCLLWLHPSPAYAVDRISLKKYPALSLQVPNPMETSKLPARKTFQVNHEGLVLQFFFNERDVFGYILKRNKRLPIHFRWCFFRSCEESPYDYKKVIAQAFHPPYDSGFFSIEFPSYLNYSFQGIEFSSPK
jgi:hypothetical protein